MLNSQITITAFVLLGITMSQPGCQTNGPVIASIRLEKQITRGPGGRVLTNTGVWSPDGEWIVYDTRSDPAGDSFDGNSIEMVNVHSGEVRKFYRAKNGAH